MSKRVAMMAEQGPSHDVPPAAFGAPLVSNSRRPGGLSFGTGSGVSGEDADPNVEGVSGGVISGVAQTMVQGVSGGETAPKAVRAGNRSKGLTELTQLDGGMPKMLPS